MERKKYVILKDGGKTPFSQVINDCDNFCFPAKSGDSLSTIFKKLCNYIKTNNTTGIDRELDPIFQASPSFNITNLNISNWNEAFSWGDHSLAGYLTSFTEEDPIYTVSSWYTTINNSVNWDEAFSWGDHAGLYSLLGHTHTLSNLEASGASSGDVIQWNGTNWVPATVGGGGPESDPIYTASSWFSTTNNSTNWNTAFGWGNHASAGYFSATQMSLTSNGSGLKLVNDNATPGNNYYYGTDHLGVKGFFSLPTIDNIYTADGSLISDRTLDLNSFDLNIVNPSGLNLIKFSNGVGYLELNGPFDQVNIFNGHTLFSVIDGIRFGMTDTGTAYLKTDNITLATTVDLQMPNLSGNIPLTVNGNTANSDGEITLDLSIYQPKDNDLTAIAALGFTSTAFLKKTGVNTWTLDTNTYLTSFTESDPIWIADKPSYLTSALAASTYAAIAHTHTFASLTSKPTTLSGYGITDAQPLDSDLTAIAALTTTSFGRGLLTESSASTLKTTLSLDNVDNTSDINKPVSTAQAAADALKVTANALITGATKTKITYDSKGLVTAGADIAASDLPTGIDAAKIGAGNISNTEFGYLDGVTSAIQTQLDAKGNSVNLLADANTTNTTFTNTNLVFSALANKTYNVRIWGHVSKATTTTGLKIGVIAPAGATITGTESRGAASYTTALTNGEVTAINTLGGTFATGAGIKVAFRIEFTITTSATAGNIGLGFATVTSNQATIYAGTNMRWIESTGV